MQKQHIPNTLGGSVHLLVEHSCFFFYFFCLFFVCVILFFSRLIIQSKACEGDTIQHIPWFDSLHSTGVPTELSWLSLGSWLSELGCCPIGAEELCDTSAVVLPVRKISKSQNRLEQFFHHNTIFHHLPNFRKLTAMTVYFCLHFTCAILLIKNFFFIVQNSSCLFARDNKKKSGQPKIKIWLSGRWCESKAKVTFSAKFDQTWVILLFINWPQSALTSLVSSSCFRLQQLTDNKNLGVQPEIAAWLSTGQPLLFS